MLSIANILSFVALFAGCFTLADTRNCGKFPETMVDTTARLAKLRDEMHRENIQAYVVPSTDAHGSEYIRKRDKRRKFISGFSGSAGTAIVTLKHKAALWTDGRYFLQGEMELDCNWILQKSGQPGVLTKTEWLKHVLKSGEKVGIDPYLISINGWNDMEAALKKKGIVLVGIKENLVDRVWTERPGEELLNISVQELSYTGKKWSKKVQEVQEEMKNVEASAHVVMELDSISWLLNLRGKEVPYNPVFFAYVVVKKDEVLFYVKETKISPYVRKHLQLSNCPKIASYCIKIRPYDSIASELSILSKTANAKLWISPKVNYALKQDVDDSKIYLEWSPIRLMKAKKNKVELDGMRKANLKDSVALTYFFMYAEKRVAEKDEFLTELSLEAKMKELRSQQPLYQSLSFPSIVGFGPNGAIIHYKPSNKTDRKITDESTLLVDTGSQYLDGTTDITRTVHFGTPTAKQKDAFTRILMGQIDLAMAVFPEGTHGRFVDIIARQPLFKNGLNYRHGTGHGIGSYLYIHEGPGRINAGCPLPFEKPMSLGFVFSDEPGYYEDGSFGIRIETAVVVVNASTPVPVKQ
ncbi:xaa-Pro aminopeptidase 1-like isoform X2 [Xenia sp. Carnegie-2017]|uniref:xaa-Pro aminopeptidase 1-like isoform X2 n=1 Tax=Xenia sp. Carnegie-2017 TaxID=2897299 RepID=UPI001F039942|nr:xaa-Pro aminopeptidase 1-like isoform X2 [Xenia sp. Carnegie-2017]